MTFAPRDQNLCGGAAWPSGLVASLGIPFPIGLPMLPQCPEGCLVHPSNTALGYLPELLSPAPLRCGVGKGTPNSVVNVLHAHKTRTTNRTEPCLALEGMGRPWHGAARGPAKRRILRAIAGVPADHVRGRTASQRCPLCQSQAYSQCC